MNKKDFYAIVFKSGQFVTRCNTDEFKQIPLDTVECFLYARYDNTFTGTSNITDWYQFYFVNNNGQPTSYRVGDFEVSYLGTDNGYTNFFGRDVTIRDCRTDHYYEYKSMCRYNRFIPDEIKPLLEKLNHCENEDEISQLLKVHTSYEKLEYKFRSLTNSYNSLKEENEKMKIEIEKLNSVMCGIRKALGELDAEQNLA